MVRYAAHMERAASPPPADWTEELHAQGRTMTWLAAEVHVSRTYLQDVAAGRKQPSPDLLSRIRIALGSDPGLRLRAVREFAAQRARWRHVEELAREMARELDSLLGPET